MQKDFQPHDTEHNTNPKDLLGAKVGQTFKIALNKKQGGETFIGHITLMVILVMGSRAMKVIDSTFEPIPLKDFHRLHLWISTLSQQYISQPRGIPVEAFNKLVELHRALRWAISDDYYHPSAEQQQSKTKLKLVKSQPTLIKEGDEKAGPINKYFVFTKINPGDGLIGSSKFNGRENYITLRKYNDGHGEMMTLVNTNIEDIKEFIGQPGGTVSMTDIMDNVGDLGHWLYIMLPVIGGFSWQQ